MMATRPGVLRQRKPERPDLTGEGTAGGERGSGVRSATLKGHALAETYSTVTAGKVVCKPQRHSRVSPLNLKRASKSLHCDHEPSSAAIFRESTA
jgi:hypothetical protein